MAVPVGILVAVKFVHSWAAALSFTNQTPPSMKIKKTTPVNE
jgi:hypothetical protein